MGTCYRCKREGVYTWNICADGNKIRWVCEICDIKLNEVVLKFMKFRNWKSKIKRYKEKLRG